MTRSFVLAILLLLPQLAAAGEGELWSVVGLRSPRDPPMQEAVATLRGALALELAARGGGRVLGEEETRARLGLGGESLRAVREKVDAAELYYFQLELGLARTNLEEALEALAHCSGVPEAWERTRVARLLLGMVHLAAGTEEGRALASAQFELLARLQPAVELSPSIYPAEVVALYEEARRRVAGSKSGTLRVLCTGECAGGQVWVDTLPMGVPGESIELAAGRYRVLATDRFEGPQIRSLLREIEIRPGEETLVRIDLELEGAVSGNDGPSLLLRDVAVPEAGARLLAAHVGTDRALALSLVAGGFDAHVVGPGDELRVHRVLLEPDDTQAAALSRLARLVLGGGLVASLPGAAPMPAEAWVAGGRPEPAAPKPWLGWARWSSAGAAVLAAGAGTWLRLDAASREDELAAQLRRWGGTYPDATAARRGAGELRSIASTADWGTGLLVGAGVAAATSLTLFLLDDGDGTGTSQAGVIDW